jgi:hypothetical protein
MTKDLVDRIEKRRFVGREFLLWLWFESEVFEGTLRTKAHGEFGMWIERQIVLSAGREVTRIKGAYPAGSREAKEALLRGKLPDTAGIHLSWNDQESNFVLKAETMGVSGLSLPTVLGGAEEEAAPRVDRPPPRPTKKKRAASAEDERAAESDEQHEAFYERMHLTREFEGLLEALYRDFVTLRLGDAWADVVVPALLAWVAGDDELDADAYRKARDRALGGTRRR